MINLPQFRQHIIKPALSNLQLWSPEAEELLVFTCAVETNGGSYIVQQGGPALGVFQMEPNTLADLFHNYINNKPNLLGLLAKNFSWPQNGLPDRIIYDLRFAAAMTRIFYLRCPGALPAANDVIGIWNYYKQFYNTAAGAAQETQSIQAYRAWVGLIVD